jgi:hypothetical protein
MCIKRVKRFSLIILILSLKLMVLCSEQNPGYGGTGLLEVSHLQRAMVIVLLALHAVFTTTLPNFRR